MGRRDGATEGELGRLAWLLDELFRVPGTDRRFGLDSIIGLLPGVGDVTSGVLGLYLVARAVQLRLPWVVVARMVANTLLDAVAGLVPLLGDAFDFFYKANSRNLALIRDYSADPARSTREHKLFLLGLLAVVIVLVVLMAAALEALASLLNVIS